MLLAKPAKAILGGSALFLHAMASPPLLGKEPLPLDEATLKRAAAPATLFGTDRRSSREEPDDAHERDDTDEIVRSLQAAEAKLPISDPVFGHTIHPLGGPPVTVDPATNFVFSATLQGIGH